MLWNNVARPGSSDSETQWGTATDGVRIYVAEANGMDQNYTLPVGLSINTGSWAALDPAACKTIWQVTHPSKDFDIASVTSDNGIVYVGSMTGNAYPLDAATGAVVWFVKEVQSSNAAPAIVGGTVFWWSGYYPARTSGQYPDRRAVRIFRRRALA